MNKLTLKFRDRKREEEFRADYFAGNLTQVRASLMLGCVLYAVFGFLDPKIIPEFKEGAWFIRFCLVCPLLFASYIFTYSRHFPKVMQPVLFMYGAVAAAGIIVMLACSYLFGNYLYYVGLLLCLMFFYTFTRLRFIGATILCWGIFIMYEIICLVRGVLPQAVLINNTFFFLAFNIAGMSAAYSIERYMRLDFLQRRLIQQKGEELAIALNEVERARHEAEEISKLDPLTNLYNRRHFFAVAEERAAFECIALVMIDIDHFKRVNDLYGHTSGDQVLLEVAGRISEAMRRSDTPCRYGGEEFAVFLPDTDLETAVRIGRRLKERIDGVVQTDAASISITVSMGIAAADPSGLVSVDELIERADRVLYRAKKTGRDRICVWDDDEEQRGPAEC
ncbi:GGDEF domain-containing protein [Geobacter sp. DSM 9736]|uniref:GGDEF domain-containing protein n=1 Tax=Geobacter sp. DSM 9736 TaxID=1277350 RepID=UPI000B50700D|nr:GGDEF domain-containing protein [Geobacter sp. DSM 9736]SNB46046.1 diguanylate cyclase (GGDEF) domain-containing protein [Geobacter sp. DSM 9736]